MIKSYIKCMWYVEYHMCVISNIKNHSKKLDKLLIKNR